MTTYLFTIRPVNYTAAETALQTVGCWLEGPGSKATVACSGAHANEAQQMREQAEEALEHHGIMVYPD